MIIESYSEKETFELGYKLGKGASDRLGAAGIHSTHGVDSIYDHSCAVVSRGEEYRRFDMLVGLYESMQMQTRLAFRKHIFKWLVH